MKISRRTFIKRINLALAGVIGMLGFAGCEGWQQVEYGTPLADFTVKGSVVNKATGKPVKGIRVGYDSVTQVIALYGVIPTPYQPKKHVLSDAKGEFKFTESAFDSKNLIIPIYVEDIDGEENGSFQPEYLQVDFSNAEHSGKPKNWYGGEYTVTMKVELTEIENESDE
jgi:putative lipoprotein (rSAM/lipoprotein system)